MIAKGNKEKLLYTMLGSVNDKLQNLRIIYNETGDRRYLGPMAQASKDLKKIVNYMEGK